MKFIKLLPSLLLAASASAQYFSAGWSPGQPAPDSPAAAPDFNFDPSKSAPGSPAAAGEAEGVDKSKLGFVDKILTSPAVAGLFGKLGVNITDAVVRGSQSPWDDRIPLITDENYEDVVVNEQFKSEEEARDRVWIFVMCVLLFPVSPRVLCSCSFTQLRDGVAEQRHLEGRGPKFRSGIQHHSHRRRPPERPLGAHRLHVRHIPHHEMEHLDVSWTTRLITDCARQLTICVTAEDHGS